MPSWKDDPAVHGDEEHGRKSRSVGASGVGSQGILGRVCEVQVAYQTWLPYVLVVPEHLGVTVLMKAHLCTESRRASR